MVVFMRKLFCTVFGVMVVTCMATVANADQSTGKIYAEVDYMHLDMNWKTSGVSIGANPPALGVKLGVRLNDNFEIEALLGKGIGSDSFFAGSVPNVGFANLGGELKSLYAVNLLLDLAAADYATIYGKLGYSKLELNLNFDPGLTGGPSASGSESFRNTGLLYGIGVAIELIKNHSLTVEYIVLPDVKFSGDGYDFGKVETKSLTVGFKYNF